MKIFWKKDLPFIYIQMNLTLWFQDPSFTYALTLTLLLLNLKDTRKSCYLWGSHSKESDWITKLSNSKPIFLNSLQRNRWFRFMTTLLTQTELSKEGKIQFCLCFQETLGRYIVFILNKNSIYFLTGQTYLTYLLVFTYLYSKTLTISLQGFRNSWISSKTLPSKKIKNPKTFIKKFIKFNGKIWNACTTKWLFTLTLLHYKQHASACWWGITQDCFCKKQLSVVENKWHSCSSWFEQIDWHCQEWLTRIKEIRGTRLGEQQAPQHSILPLN